MTDHKSAQLQDIEAIRQLKARYVRFGDTKQWDQFGKLITDDYEAKFDAWPRMSRDGPTSGAVKGKDVFLGAFSVMLEHASTIHQVYSSEITITGPNTATGIWSMHDVVKLPTCVFKGWGFYNEEYVKVDGRWKISRSHVTRLHSEEQWL